MIYDMSDEKEQLLSESTQGLEFKVMSPRQEQFKKTKTSRQQVVERFKRRMIRERVRLIVYT